MLLKVVKRLMRLVLDVVVITLLLTLIPGLPPYVSFPSYTITPPRPLEGPLEPNHRLDQAECFYEGSLRGPESVVFKGEDIYTGVLGGYVVKIGKNGKITNVVRFGQECDGPWEESKCGRPLGLNFDKDGSLVVADAYYGLFRVDVNKGTYQTLVSSSVPIDGKTPKCPNNLDIADDGTIYWSDSSTFVPLEDSLLEVLSEPSGRLLKYDPKTNQSTVLVSSIHFANGVQLSPKEDYVLVSETARARILRHYLKGKKKGQTDVFIDGLPGTPDNIRSNDRGGYYVSLFSPRLQNHFDFIDFLADKPFLRKIAARLLYTAMHTVGYVHQVFPNVYLARIRHFLGHLEPVSHLQPKQAIVVDIDVDGNIIGSLHGMNGKVLHASEAAVYGDYMYLGSPFGQCLWRVLRATRVNVKKTVGELNVM